MGAVPVFCSHNLFHNVVKSGAVPRVYDVVKLWLRMLNRFCIYGKGGRAREF